MDEQFWRDKWANNQIAFHHAEANPLLVRHFNAMKAPAAARVLVPLCGKSGDLVWLAGQGRHVTGVELSRLAVEQFFDELGGTPRVSDLGSLRRYEVEGISIYQGSVFDVTAEMVGPVDLVYDRAALVALPEEMRDRYAARVMVLAGSAPHLLIAYEYDQSCIDGPPFSVTEAEVRRLYSETFDLQLLERQEVSGGLKGKCPAVETVWHLRSRGMGTSALNGV